MKKFLCNLIVPALMFASLLTMPLWAGKAPQGEPEVKGVEQSQPQAPLNHRAPNLVAGVADRG